MTKTITLTGTEASVTDLGGQHVGVKNLGEGSIYASAFPNVITGEDNVIEITAGSGEVLLDARGKVYLLGMGKVQLTGTNYPTPNFKLPSSSEGGGGATSDVTKGYVDAQDTSNLASAKAYTDSKVGAATDAANEAKTAANTAKEAADAANVAATSAQTAAVNAETKAAAADEKAEAAKNAAEDLANKSVVSEDGAFDLRYADSKLQANVDGEWKDISAGGGESGGVSQDYVDTHDAATLTAAKEYTDSKIQPLQAAITENAEDIQSLADRVSDTENAIDVLNGTGEGSVSRAVADGIAEAIADAPESLDVLKEISAWIQQYPEDAAAMNARIQQNEEDIADINNENTGILAKAKEYIDTETDGTLAAAKEYTDSKTAEALETAQSYAEEKAGEAADGALEAAKTHTDAEIGAVKEDVAKNSDDISALHTDLVQAQTTANEAQMAADEAKETADAAVQTAKEYTDTVAADKADKPVNAFVLIQTTNWESDDHTYPYYYDIQIEGVTSADRADVFFAADSEEAAKKCEFSAEVTTSDGAVKIRAKHIPETVLSANVQIGILSATDTLHIGGDNSVNGGSIDEHNADPEAHPDLRAYVNELKGRIVALEVAAGGDIDANPFAVTFGDLDGVIADGVWVPASARLEF